MKKRQWFLGVLAVMIIVSGGPTDAEAQLPVVRSYDWVGRSDELPGLQDMTIVVVGAAAVAGFVAWKLFRSDDETDANEESAFAPKAVLQEAGPSNALTPSGFM